MTGQQYEIRGKVMNRTRNRPVPNQTIEVLAVREGMQTVKTVKTDGEGVFRISSAELDSQGVYLLHFFFDDVRYDTPFDLSGNREMEIAVYDKSAQVGDAVRIRGAIVHLRAEGSRMKIEQAYEVVNAGTPPRVFAGAQGTFQVQVDSAAPPRISATAVMGLPIPQQVEPTGRPNEYRIYYPMKPGATIVHVSYETDYAGGEYEFHDRVGYPIDRLEVLLSPSELAGTSSLLASEGVDSQMQVARWEAEGVRAGAPFEIRVTGAAAPAGSAPPQVAASEPSAGDELIRTVPNAVDRYQVWLVLSIFLVLVAGAVFSLWKSRRVGRAA